MDDEDFTFSVEEVGRDGRDDYDPIDRFSTVMAAYLAAGATDYIVDGEIDSYYTSAELGRQAAESIDPVLAPAGGFLGFGAAAASPAVAGIGINKLKRMLRGED